MTRVPDGPILFYDGECGLCHASVRWCLRHDRGGIMSYAPLYGPTFHALVREPLPTVETVVLSDGTGIHVGSDAVIRTLGHLGGRWAFAGKLLKAIPRPLRETGYRFVARHRRQWFGGAERCPLPDVTVRERLLP